MKERNEKKWNATVFPRVFVYRNVPFCRGSFIPHGRNSGASRENGFSRLHALSSADTPIGQEAAGKRCGTRSESSRFYA